MDYYTQYCFKIDLPKEQVKWAKEFYAGATKADNELDSGFIASESGHQMHDYIQFQEDHIIFTAMIDENGIDETIRFIQEILKKFDMQRSVFFEYAHTGSRDALGVYGGGAVLVTRDVVVHLDSGELQPYLHNRINPIAERKRATILAALRFWQRHGPKHPNSFYDRITMEEQDFLDDIRTDSGRFEDLSIEEIDELCEKINREPI